MRKWGLQKFIQEGKGQPEHSDSLPSLGKGEQRVCTGDSPEHSWESQLGGSTTASPALIWPQAMDF